MLKTNYRTLKSISFVLLVLVLLNSCATMKPLWTVKGTGAFGKDETKYFYGVGSAERIKNRSMQMSTADHRARLEISKTVETYIAGFLTDFMVEYPDYFKSGLSGFEEHREQVSKEITEQVLTGCQIIDHWTDPANGMLYSLAQMPKNSADNRVVETMKKDKQILLESKKDEALKKLEEELEKRDIREQKRFGQKTPETKQNQ